MWGSCLHGILAKKAEGGVATGKGSGRCQKIVAGRQKLPGRKDKSAQNMKLLLKQET